MLVLEFERKYVVSIKYLRLVVRLIETHEIKLVNNMSITELQV